MIPIVPQALVVDPGDVQTQKNRIGQICRHVEWSANPGDLKGKRSKLCWVNNPQGDTVVQ